MKENIDYVKIIKSKLNLLDFIGKDLKLIKSGANYKALCPFHNEKTPSFLVNQEKNTFNCFGCGKSGDIFNALASICFASANFPSLIKASPKLFKHVKSSST